TAFGRTGRWFASDRAGVVADVVTVSKGLSSGYFPISAVIARRKVADEFDGDPVRAFNHGHTFGGHPVACAAALENLRIIDDEQLVDRAKEMGRVMLGALEPLRAQPLVSDVRGVGLIYGVELADPGQPDEAPVALGNQVLAALRRHGVLTFVLSPGNLLFLCPPL